MRVFVTTQMRTGSTWLCDVLSSLLSVNWSFWKKGYLIRPNRYAQEIRRGGNKVIKLHWATPKIICEQIPHNNKHNFVISITRNIRDIAVSMAMYARYDSVVRSSGRLKEIDDVRKQIHHRLNDKNFVNRFVETNYFKDSVVNHWKQYNNGYTHPNYMLVHYEDLFNHPMRTVKNITNFLGMNIGANKIRGLINKNNFKSKTRRNPGSENNKAFRRKGIAGDWKNYLNEKSLQLIDELLNGKS